LRTHQSVYTSDEGKYPNMRDIFFSNSIENVLGHLLPCHPPIHPP